MGWVGWNDGVFGGVNDIPRPVASPPNLFAVPARHRGPLSRIRGAVVVGQRSWLGCNNEIYVCITLIYVR